MTAATVERPHGYAKYRLEGCRCNKCGWERSLYDQDRDAAIRAGTWQPYVDAEPAREHARRLMEAGIGWRRLAVLAGSSTGAIKTLLWGKSGREPSKRIRPELAESILSLRPGVEAKAAGANVDATGTKLSMLPGLAGYGGTRVRNHAAEQGWFPPLAWDDETIDDPAAVPQLLPPGDVRDVRADEWAIQHWVAGRRMDMDSPTRNELMRRLSVNGWTNDRLAKEFEVSKQRASFICQWKPTEDNLLIGQT